MAARASGPHGLWRPAGLPAVDVRGIVRPSRGRSGQLATVAVSECLLGRAVRWDGDDNGDAWPREAVARLFHCVGLCPEVGIGMGVPRPPIQLAGTPDAPRAVAVDDPTSDYTVRLAGYARRMATTLDGVAGYVFADRSPSCGLAGVPNGRGRRGRPLQSPRSRRLRGGRAGRTARSAAVDAETLNCRDVLIDFALAVVAYARRHRGAMDTTEARATIERRIARP